VRINVGPPARTDAGNNEEITGAGLLIANDAAPDVPPPGLGLLTVMLALPAVAMFVAVTAAVSCVADTNVVVRLEPFHCTVELEMKLVPFTASENAPPPAVAKDGEIDAIAGDGFEVAVVLPLPLPPQLAIAIPMPITPKRAKLLACVFVLIFTPRLASRILATY
jgi:hypothetical protein